MEKKLLIEKRHQKGLSQQQVAELMSMDVSNYNRREKGQCKIRGEEWEKLSKIFDVPVEEIYESEESHYFVFKDSSVGNYQGTNNIYSIPEHFIDMHRKYTIKLEEEIERLKKATEEK
jgi:transcriptional regulator with XRE-family HTH domain